MIASISKYVTASSTKSLVTSVAFHAAILGAAGWMVTDQPLDRVRLPGKPVTINMQIDSAEPTPPNVAASLPAAPAMSSVVVSPDSAMIDDRRYELVPTFAEVSTDGVNDELFDETIPEESDAATESTDESKELNELPAEATDFAAEQLQQRRQQKLERQGIDDIGPKLESTVPLVYPPVALRNRWEGIPQVEVTIAATGEVTRAVLKESSGHPVLDAAAVNFLLQCRYTPRTMAGIPVECIEIQPVNFFLK